MLISASKVIRSVGGLISQLTETGSPSRSEALPNSIKSDGSFETSIVSPLKEPAYERVGLLGFPGVAAVETGSVATELVSAISITVAWVSVTSSPLMPFIVKVISEVPKANPSSSKMTKVWSRLSSSVLSVKKASCLLYMLKLLVTSGYSGNNSYVKSFRQAPFLLSLKLRAFKQIRLQTHEN